MVRRGSHTWLGGVTYVVRRGSHTWLGGGHKRG